MTFVIEMDAFPPVARPKTDPTLLREFSAHLTLLNAIPTLRTSSHPLPPSTHCPYIPTAGPSSP